MSRLSMALCPACEQPNADDARTCRVCGTPLVMRCPACDLVNVRTRAACRGCHAPLALPGRASDATGVGGGSDAGPDTEPAVALTLRADLLDGHGLPPSPCAATPPAASPWPTGSDARWATRSDGLDWPPIVDEAAPPAPPAPPAVPLGQAARMHRHQIKVERRAKVRQRQMRARRDHAGPTPTPAPDVLLLESDAATRQAVREVLEDFGFRLHMAADADEAMASSLVRRYAAVLLGVHAAGQDTADLCHRLRRQPAFGATPVFAIVDAAGHADRVRMRLAGALDTLMRPVSRGALAHMLHMHDIVLPCDPRGLHVGDGSLA